MNFRNLFIPVVCLAISLLFARVPAISQNPQAGERSSLSARYATAIGDYLQALPKVKLTVPDTLFILKRRNGQPDDFPDIILPARIRGTQIRVILPADTVKYRFSETAPCINLIGWVEKEKAEFTFVAFWPGFHHRFDAYLNYRFNAASKTYSLQPVRVEVLVYGKDGKADHFEVYEDGRKAGMKPLQ